MAVHLASVVTDLEAALDSPRPAEVAAKQLEETMRTVLGRSDMLGGDLRMSGFKGAPVKLQGEHKTSLAWLTLAGGTFALIDGGRKPGGTKRIYARGRRRGHAPALSTPYGPRRWVKRGRGTTGKNIADRYAPKALDDAVTAASKVVDDIFARTI